MRVITVSQQAIAASAYMRPHRSNPRGRTADTPRYRVSVQVILPPPKPSPTAARAHPGPGHLVFPELNPVRKQLGDALVALAADLDANRLARPWPDPTGRGRPQRRAVGIADRPAIERYTVCSTTPSTTRR